MSVSGYTPSMEEIRAAAILSLSNTGRGAKDSDRARAGLAFDRALAAHDAVVAAKAWDEGAQFAAVECNAIDDEKQAWVTPSDNPYRDQIGENK